MRVSTRAYTAAYANTGMVLSDSGHASGYMGDAAAARSRRREQPAR
jgi:hypothetical protein